ncbi:MAG: hypothetical protein U0235_18485 [Polyangiaceae bacterium]
MSVAVTTVTALLSLGCSATPADEGDDEPETSEGALSEASCKPVADKAQAAAKASCEKENAFDWDKCMAPAQTVIDKYRADVSRARAAVQGDVDAVTGDCRAAVAQMKCSELGDGNDYANAAAARAKSETPLCASLRDRRMQKCDVDAQADLEARLGTDNEYVKLNAQFVSKWAAYFSDVAVCATKSAASTGMSAICSAKGLKAYQDAFATCRKQCPDVAKTACAPKGYAADVRCGAYKNVTGFSLRVGQTCEDGQTCERTAVCDQYDAAAKTASQSNQSTSCDASGAPGALIPEVRLVNNVASSVVLTCKAYPMP